MRRVIGLFVIFLLVIGQVNLAEEESRQRTHTLVKEFVDRFTALHGSIACKELIGYDLSNSGELRLARESGVLQNKCPVFVYDSACILEDVLHLR